MSIPSGAPSPRIPLPSFPPDEVPTMDPIPIILEDMDGSLRRTVLRDLERRGHFFVSPWSNEGAKGIKIQGDIQSSPKGNRTVFVEWGEEIGEGTIHVENPRRSELVLDLAEYLPIIDPQQYTPETIEYATRSFFSFLDGNKYVWRYHPPENLEMQWECIDLSEDTIAYWSLKLPTEPEYDSSGCSLTVCEGHELLTLEMLTTCIIVRTLQDRYHRLRPPTAEPDEPEEPDEEALAKARADYENRWADCESSSDDSPPSSESDGNENDGSENKGSVVDGPSVHDSG